MTTQDPSLKELIPTWVGGDLVAVEKLEAHRKGYLHMAVSVFVTCGNDVLTQRRAMGKYHTPGLWANTCCTHPRWGEAPMDCAHRRLREELGIEGLKLEPRQKVTYLAEVGNGMVEHERVDIFLARVKSRITPHPNPEEVMATEWVDMDELARRTRAMPERYTPWLRIYLEEHAEQIFA